MWFMTLTAMAQSKAASRKGRLCPSPVTAGDEGSFAAARPTMPGEWSMSATRNPAAARGAALLPVPQPMSSNVRPAGVPRTSVIARSTRSLAPRVAS
jgi:hypothetical protein